MLTPRIYVACLASYNNGVLHGAWIDATQDAEAIEEDIAAMLRASPYPNVAVRCPDCEGFGQKSIGHNSETGATLMGTCETCSGRGEVPSSEEWAIHDSEGFYGISIDESMSLADVSALAQALEEHGEPFALYLYNFNVDYANPAVFEDAYAGAWDSLEDFAANYLDETGVLDTVPETLRGYFDYKAFARDMVIGGDVWSERGSDGTVHVFWNR